MNIDITTKTLLLVKTHSTPHEGFIFVGNRPSLHWLEAKLLPLLHSTYIVIGVLLYMLGGILLREHVQTRATVGEGLFAFAASQL